MLRSIIGRKFSSPIVHLSRWMHLTPAAFQTTTKYTETGDDCIVKSRIICDIPEDLSIYQFVTADFPKHGDKIAMIDGMTDRKLTFSNLHSLVKKFGSYIRKQGVKPRDALALYLSNCIEYAAPILGMAAIGGIVTTVNPLYTKYELANQLKDSKSKILVTNNALLQNAVEAADMAGGVDKIIVIDECNDKKDIIDWGAIETDDESAFEVVDLKPRDEVASLPYSSGTTGLPKGVMLSHHNLVSNMIQMQHAIFVDPNRTISLGLLPFFHAYGLVVILLLNLLECKTVVSLPKFEPSSFLSCINKHKVDFANLVPPLFLFMSKHPVIDDYDISSLRGVTTGAAPVGDDLFSAFQKRFPNIKFILQGYGLSETSPGAITQPLDWVKSGSIGVPFPNTEVKVVDVQTDEALGPNRVGEILIRGPQIMKGYLNRPEATTNTITEDGWLRSGDVGYYDDDLHFYIVDRIKELIKYKGFQVPPAELEDLLLSHPNVTDAAVIGIPNEEAGEIPLAFVVIKGDVTEEDIAQFVEERVAPHKKLRGGIQFIEAIPKSASGKILRRVLKEQFLQK